MRTVLVMMAVALLFGCGSASGGASPSTQAAASSSAPSGPPKAVDACTVVTSADAQSVLGQAEGPGHSSHTMSRGIDAYECDYAPSGLSLALIVVIKAPISRATFDSERNIFATHFQVQDASGIGQTAYTFGQSSNGVSIGTINFLQGPYEVDIAGYVSSAAPAVIVARVTAVARAASTRLPK